MISAAQSQGTVKYVAPKTAIYKNRPKAAPFAADFDFGMRQAKVITIARHCPPEPIR